MRLPTDLRHARRMAHGPRLIGLLESTNVKVFKAAEVRGSGAEVLERDYALWEGAAESLLHGLPNRPLFDLVVTSPPYNLGKSYEKRSALDDDLAWQESVIDEVVARVKPTGSIFWQVGNFVDNGQIVPLDIELAPIV